MPSERGDMDRERWYAAIDDRRGTHVLAAFVEENMAISFTSDVGGIPLRREDANPRVLEAINRFEAGNDEAAILAWVGSDEALV